MARRNLTAETLGRIKPGAARKEIADSVLPGLYLVIQPSGSRGFAVRTRIGDRTVKLTLGRWPVLDLGAARDLARAKLQAIAAGIDPREADKEAAAATKRTVRAVCEEWFQRDQTANRDINTVRRIMAREVLPFIGDMQIEAVRKRDLIELVDRVADRAPIRANRVLAHTKRLFAWAAGRDLIEASPASSIERPTAERSRDRVLSDAELVEIWRAADRIGGAYGPGIHLVMLTGARIAEVFAARWQEIEGGALQLPASRSKSREGRTIWLAPLAQRIIAALPRYAGSEWMLTATGSKPFRAANTAKIRLDKAIAVGRAERRLGRKLEPGEHPDPSDAMPPWRVHDLRRTCATGLQRLGCRLEVIEHVLGHVSGSRAGLVGTYQKHRFEQETAAAVALWGQHIEGLIGRPSGKSISAPLEEDNGR